MSETEAEYIEAIVCKNSDIPENGMKIVNLGGARDVLLVRQKGRINALGTKCTHFGAPLTGGALGNGRLRCQWHGACFNILNGDIEDSPGLDSLPCYQVTIVNDDVKVRAKRTDLQRNKRVKEITGIGMKSLNFVVIGGGVSGAVCVETLRQEGFEGKITLVCKENYLPYDRVLVNKAMGFTLERGQFRNEKFYQDYRIDIIKGNSVTSVNSSEGFIKLNDGTNLNFDKLYIATGLQARKIQIPGSNLTNVVTLRTYEDSLKTNEILNNDNIKVVILGSSFIALETAFFCINQKKITNITIVMRNTVPFQKLLGEKIGTALKNLLQNKGVNFIVNSGIQNIIDTDNDGKINQVELIDGKILPADILVLGIGSESSTDFLKGSGIELQTNGSIEVNEYLQSNIPNIYVGGDIALAPVSSYNNRKIAIAHFGIAQKHGRIAALNMVGKKTKLEVVPFFWSKMGDLSVRYCGTGTYNDIIYVGDVDNLKFVAYYLDGNDVIAVSSVGKDPIVSQFAELLAQGEKLERKDVENDDKFLWTTKLLT